MNSTETSSDPWSSSTEHNDPKAGIDDRDSRNAEEVSFADIAGVVKNLNEKICLLRREILELRDCGRVSVVRKSVPEIIESGNPSGSDSRDKLSAKNLGLSFIRRITPLYFLDKISRINESKESNSASNLSILSNHYVYTRSQDDVPFKSETQSGKGLVYVVGSQAKSRSSSPFKPDKDSKIRKRFPGKRSAIGSVSGDADLLGRGEKKILNEPEEIKKGRENNAPGDNKIRSNRDANNEDDKGNETTNTSENCLSRGIPCVERRKRMGNWKKSKPITKPVILNKCGDKNCYGKRVRKRISRGVQTAPKKRCRIVNLLRKFRWRLRKKKRKKEEFTTAGETTLSNKVSAADMIYEPSGASARSDNTTSNVESNDVTSEANEERNRERKQQSDDFLSRNLKKNMYEPSSTIVDDTKVETSIHKEENVSVTKRKKCKPHKNIIDTGSEADLREKNTNLGGIKRSKKSKRKVGNLSSSDVESSNHVGEFIVDESKSRESVNNKHKNDERIDKTKIIRRKCRKKAIKTVNEAPNSEEKKDARLVEEKIDERDNRAAVKPAAKRRTKRSKNRKNSRTSLKAFTDTVRNSFSQQRPSLIDENQERRNELIGERLNARKNEIADVKRRLDACIDDLNDIILTLSKLFQEAPASRGPGSEGTQPKTLNSSHRNRSRLR